MRTKSPFRILIVAVAVMVIWGITPMAAFGYPVEPLPEDNLIVNPWFRSAAEPSVAGTDGWVVVTVDGVGWGKSQKETNPSPDIVISGVCGFQEVYCGTGMRWAYNQSKGVIEKHPNLDVYFYQVVQSDPGQRKLKFSMHWVNHKIDIFEAVVYGSESADGPWVPVWEVIRITQDQNPPPGEAPGRQGIPWFETGIMETVIVQGYAYYKVEFHARYPESDGGQGDVGVKVTGVYFATELTDDDGAAATPQLVHNPTVVPPAGSTSESTEETDAADATARADSAMKRTEQAEAAAIAQAEAATETRQAKETPTETVTPTQTPTERVLPSPTSSPVPEPSDTSGDMGTGFIYGIIATAALIGLFLAVRGLVRKS